MDIQKQVISVSDIKDIISLEVIQHEKVKLLLGSSSTQNGITAELLSPGCQNDLPCSRLSHNILHTDTQSFLSLSVHPEDTDENGIYVTALLALISSMLFCIWMFQKWKQHAFLTDTQEKDLDGDVKKSLDEDLKLMNECRSSSQPYSPTKNDSHLSASNMTLRLKHRPWTPWLGALAGLSLILVVCTLFAGGDRDKGNYSSVLKVTIPHKTNVRHIRSYSEDPKIRDVEMVKDGSSSLVTRLQLLDLSPECRGNLTVCKTHALCEGGGLDGDIKCRCNRGYFLRDLECVPCSTSCQDGFYMTKQCSAEANVMCKPCTQCEGTSYEVAACTSTQDTLCIDVTFPLKQFKSRVTSHEDLVKINVTMSSNVFLEHLHKIKKLETPLYMSNNRQEMQFVWRRPSGLEIKVKVSDIYLIPEYVDIDHVDDSKFLAKHPEYPQDIKNQIANIIKYNCRHPLPEWYDLFLHLGYDKSTAAIELTCDSQNTRQPPCPKGYSDGDTYIFNRLDIPCSKVTTADRDHADNIFSDRTNNILCSGNTDLLKSVFNIRVNDTEFLTFPSEECKKNEADCTKCLARRTCIWGSNTTDCCNLECHKNSACRQLYTDTCPVAPVECTRADISKFIIMPRYPSIMQQFSCHLQHQAPPHLYLLTYETSIPSMQFTLGERYKTVRYNNLSDLQDGWDTVDFLVMSHHTEVKYDDEVILVGNFDTTIPNTHRVKSYTLHKLKKSWEFDRSQGYDVSQDSQTRYKTRVQFERPFLYSTNSWERNGCYKNVTEIVPIQSLFHEKGMSVNEPDGKKKSGKFVYQLLSVGSVPHIRFSMPENMSILSYYRKDFATSQLVPGSLGGDIHWDTVAQVWKVTITGSIYACPGLFTVEVFSENARSRLALYDMLVNCPRNFSIYFTVRRNSVQLADLFIAVVNDTVASYRIVLSSVQGPQFFENHNRKLVSMETDYHSPWLPITIILLLCFIVSVVLLSMYFYQDSQKNKHIPIDISVPKPDLGAQITLLQSMDTVNKKPGMSSHTRCIMVTLIILYIIYIVIFTFSFLFVMFHLIQGSTLSEVSLVSNTSAKIQIHLKNKLESVVRYENQETRRMLKSTEQRLKACSLHLKSSLLKSVPDLNKELKSNLKSVFETDGAVQSVLEVYFKKRQEEYQKKVISFIQEFNNTLDKNLHKIYSTYTSYLKKVANNQWFSFPKDIFMEQSRVQGYPLADISEDITGFLTWLEIDKVEEIIRVKDNLMSRLLSMMPSIDFAKLINAGKKNKMTDMDLNLTAADNLFKFTSAPPPIYSGYKSYFGTRLNRWADDFNFLNHTANQLLNKDGSKMVNITGVIYPLFICVFLILDILLLSYRVSWLISSIRVFKNGIEQRVPFDSITRKIYFILTGKDVPRPEDSLDHPYDYYMTNKENIWGENTELYFLYCQASPKTKEEILRDIWSHKQKQKPKTEKAARKRSCIKTLLKFAYRLLISPVFWRVVIMCGFLLILCLVAKATDDLVTMESAMFLLDTDGMMPILSQQNAVTNTVISQYGDYLNDFLSNFKTVLDTEVQTLNTLLVHVTERQSELLNTLISDMCSMTGALNCPDNIHLVTLSLVSCNFLPLHVKPYTGFHKDMLKEFIQAELSPLVLNLRSILFRTLYLLLVFAAAMIVCQITARVIFVHLRRSRHLKTAKVYQLPSTLDQWHEQQSFPEKEMYASQSVIAESCESGVYDMTS